MNNLSTENVVNFIKSIEIVEPNSIHGQPIPIQIINSTIKEFNLSKQFDEASSELIMNASLICIKKNYASYNNITKLTINNMYPQIIYNATKKGIPLFNYSDFGTIHNILFDYWKKKQHSSERNKIKQIINSIYGIVLRRTKSCLLQPTEFFYKQFNETKEEIWSIVKNYCIYADCDEFFFSDINVSSIKRQIEELGFSTEQKYYEDGVFFGLKHYKLSNGDEIEYYPKKNEQDHINPKRQVHLILEEIRQALLTYDYFKNIIDKNVRKLFEILNCTEGIFTKYSHQLTIDDIKQDLLADPEFSKRLLSDFDRLKFNGIETGATRYVPECESAKRILQDKHHRFVTEDQIQRWDSVSDYHVFESNYSMVHYIEHNLNSEYITVDIWIYDEYLNRYINCIPSIEQKDNNTILIGFNTKSKIKGIIRKYDSLKKEITQ